ncbi:Plasmodium vivax Vir protein, putative [Plasmodium vivax]|nr:Plasmodium vivax Vir protein, putative [Plasmodium vivax]
MEKHLTKNDIDNLTSKISYYNFELGDDGCNDVDSFSEIRGELQQQYHFDKNISDKIVRALCFIYNRKTNHQGAFDNERCKYLYYWLGDKIYNIVHDNTMFSKIINMIYQELYRTNMFTTCTPLHENIDENTFIRYKLLFDYSKDHENIKLSTLNPNTTCDEHYKEVIDKYVNTYKDVHSSCYISYEKKYDCEKIFSLFGNKNHSELMSYLCKKQQTHTLERGKGNHRGNELPAIRVSEGNLSPVFHRALEKNLQPETPKASYLNSGSRMQHKVDSDLPLPMADTAEGSSSKTIAGSVAPVLGVSSISLLLYKVTPLGGFIRNFLGRNRNMYNPVEYMDSFNPYSDGMVPGDRRMNISYHRL